MTMKPDCWKEDSYLRQGISKLGRPEVQGAVGGSPTVSIKEKNKMSDKPDRTYLLKTLQRIKSKGIKVKKAIIKFDREYFSTNYIVSDSKRNLYIAISTSRISIDTYNMFDRLSGSPVKLPIPSNDKELDKVMKIIDSFEVFPDKWDDISNNFQTDYWIHDYNEVNRILPKIKNYIIYSKKEQIKKYTIDSKE